MQDWFERSTKKELENLIDTKTPCYLHEGDLLHDGHWQPRDSITLITGNLQVNGFLDVAPNLPDYEGWGELLIAGNVSCDNFSGFYQH